MDKLEDAKVGNHYLVYLIGGSEGDLYYNYQHIKIIYKTKTSCLIEIIDNEDYNNTEKRWIDYKNQYGGDIPVIENITDYARTKKIDNVLDNDENKVK